MDVATFFFWFVCFVWFSFESSVRLGVHLLCWLAKKEWRLGVIFKIGGGATVRLLNGGKNYTIKMKMIWFFYFIFFSVSFLIMHVLEYLFHLLKCYVSQISFCESLDTWVVKQVMDFTATGNGTTLGYYNSCWVFSCLERSDFVFVGILKQKQTFPLPFLILASYFTTHC